MLEKKSFFEGGLYSAEQKDCCFIKYLVNVIQGTQPHLKNDQMDINTDFETFISALRAHGEPLCVPSWYTMQYNKHSDHLVCAGVQIINGFDVDCTNCPFCKDESWQRDPEILSGIKLVRDGLGRCKVEGMNFIEHYISLFFPYLLQYMGNKIPEYCSVLRRHYTSPKLFCEDIETEIGLRPMIGFLSENSCEPLIMFYVALIKCQELLYFPIKEQMNDEGDSWQPHTGRELWGVAMAAVDLIVAVIRILPQIEEKYLGRKTAIDVEQILELMRKQYISSAPETAEPAIAKKGIALKQLAHSFWESMDDLIGDRRNAVINLTERMRKLQKKKKFPHIGYGKNNAPLFTAEDSVQLLQIALKNDHPISRERATLLAHSVLEDARQPE